MWLLTTLYPRLVAKVGEYFLGSGAAAVSLDHGGLLKSISLLGGLVRSYRLVSSQTDGRSEGTASQGQVSTPQHLPIAGEDVVAIGLTLYASCLKICYTRRIKKASPSKISNKAHQNPHTSGKTLQIPGFLRPNG